MKTVRLAFAIITVVYLSLIWMVGDANHHTVKFSNTACIEPFKGYEYKTCSSMNIFIDNKKYTIPKSFETDLASIPRLLWPIFAPQYSGFVAPSILHDYLYRCPNDVTRKFADEILYSALITQKVSKFTAYKFYLGVRLFGHYHFEKGVC